MNVRGFDDAHPENGHGYAPSAHVDGDVCALFQVLSEHRADVGGAHRERAHGYAPRIREYVGVHAAQSDGARGQWP